MSRSFIFLLSMISLSTLSADCPHCPSKEQGEVRVRGVLQKKPSSVVYIQTTDTPPQEDQNQEALHNAEETITGE